MEYKGPDNEDLANVFALNRAFIDAMLCGPVPDGASARLAGDLRPLGSLRRKRLASCPFLLFSLAGMTLPDGRQSNASHRQPDLLQAQEPAFGGHSRLITAALGFLWQLARRNAYAARLVTGAPLSWCERLADCTLMELLDFGEREFWPPSIVRSNDRRFWNKLLVAGTSENANVREAARLSALQTVLTASASEKLERLPAAACSMPSPVSIRVSRGYNTRPDESAVDKKPPEDL